MVVTIMCFVIAVFFLVFSILQFREIGICFNNAYLYASPEEREEMDKSPYYRQSAIVFLLLTLVFIDLGIFSIVHKTYLITIEAFIIGATLLYSMISSFMIKHRSEVADDTNGTGDGDGASDENEVTGAYKPHNLNNPK